MAQSDIMENYSKLMAKYKDLMILSSTQSIMQWDMETKMPPGAFELRSEQLSLLSRIEHKMATDAEIGAIIERVQTNPRCPSLSELQKRNVYLFKKSYDEKTKLPERLVSEVSRQEVIAYDAWKKAKNAKSFEMLKPELTKMFELKMQTAEIFKDVKGTRTCYDAMIDIFETKMTEEVIARTFDQLKRGLIPIIEKCVSSPIQPDISIIKHFVPVAKQIEISKSLAKFINYDIESSKATGRIDETEHPFTTGYYDDTRITTHYREYDFTNALFSTLHEGGHAMYEQDLERNWMYQPVGSACSYGVHESQSRFVENIIGRSPEFWSYYFPELVRITGERLPGIDLARLIKAVNAVMPSKIRIDADEVTYSMHVIIRFELERELFAGKLSIGELPQAWNQKYSDYLGVKIDNDSEGVMQDVHWSHGSFGYFPSYALGNIFSGQILYRMEKDMPSWRAGIANGNFLEVKKWLKKNVHLYGSLYDPLEMLVRITGEGINPQRFIDYLSSKYSKLYSF